MSFRKTSSADYDKAIRRISGVVAIDTKLDLGNGLTATAYQQAIDEVKNTMDDYNTTLSALDGKQNLFKSKEKTLRDWSERMLAGVAAKYGKNSDEYEKAGGTKKSDHKAAVKKKVAA